MNKPDEAIREPLQAQIDNLTKPKGSLGRLEELALKVGLIQQTTSPSLTDPYNILFAGDHGIMDEQVSVSPKEITWQQVYNFAKGGAGINFLCRQHGFTLKIVDAGVDHDFPEELNIIHKKVRKGTRNYLYESAMTEEEMARCIQYGADIVKESYDKGCNCISFGEMGIGNTSSSSLWMSCFTGIPLEQCVGAGAGLDKEGVNRKYRILKQALDNYRGNHSPTDIIRHFGGLEMVMAVGGILQAAELKMLILIDGFIMTNCLLAASQVYPEVIHYAVFGHQGDEAGHKLLLDYMHAQPILQLGLRLGEGSGAVCAYPVIESAVRMINEMESFRQAEVIKYF